MSINEFDFEPNNNNNNNNNISILDLEISLNEDTESKYSEFYNQKLIDRIKNHYSQTSNYSKKPCHRIDKEINKLVIWETSNPTGNMLRLNEIKYLAIIDIDINHKKNNSMDETRTSPLRQKEYRNSR